MKYYEKDNQTLMEDEDGVDLLANFTARIIREIRYIDGSKTESYLTITGQTGQGESQAELPPVEIDATTFTGMQWVMPNWGTRCVIRPGSSLKDHLRTAIQLFSSPKIETVYKHLGWTQLSDKRAAFLHAKGAITAAGNDPSIKVQLPAELSRFDLSANTDAKNGALAVLRLTQLLPERIAWPLMAASFAPIFGPVDFAIHVTGRTGTFKSEIMSLYQSFYGSGMDARHLPGSWSSTGNALEAQAFLAKNCAFVVDDFIPAGTSWQVRAYQQTADKLIRAQGNQAGRARLTDASNLQQTLYPRGIVLSTGEDTPEGHSVRARMLIIELSPGDIEPAKLTQAQQLRSMFPGMTAGLIKHVAGMDPFRNDLVKQRADALRDKYLKVGHSRTPTMLGRLLAVAEYVLDWCHSIGAIDEKQMNNARRRATDAILDNGGKQNQFLEASDPAEVFVATIRSVLGSGQGHMRSLAGGVPKGAGVLGWISEQANGEVPLWKSRGPAIGWVDWDQNELYLDIAAGYNIVKKAAAAELSFTKQTLLKRLKESGVLVRVDDARQRNTIRVTAEGHVRQVLAFALSDTLETQEAPQ